MIAGHDIHVDRAGNLQVPSHAVGWLGVVQVVAIFVLVASGVVSLIGQIASYRRSSGERRQQLKWLLGGSCVTMACLLLLSSVLGPGPGFRGVISQVIIVLAIIALPVSMGVAILRYRLYEIDRLISRTISYALLTAALAGVFVGLVVLLTDVLPFSSPVAVAASTLAAAALFAPLRGGLQHLIDRHFNRTHYDAQATVAAFTGRLRDAIDIDSISGELVDTVEHAIAPEHASVWVRPPRPTSD